MTITNKDGKKVNVNYCGRAAQERMIKNGWRMKLTLNCHEDEQELYDRLINLGYKEVKVYWDTTCIRGLHSYFAFVK
jgi:hypothetical protein